MEKTVKPISPAIRVGGLRTGTPLPLAGDVFEHHDGIIDDESRGDGQGHQGELSSCNEKIHDDEGADKDTATATPGMIVARTFFRTKTTRMTRAKEMPG